MSRLLALCLLAATLVLASTHVVVRLRGDAPLPAGVRLEPIFGDWYRLYVAPGSSVAATLNGARALPAVVEAYPDYIAHVDAEPAAMPAALSPNAPEYGKQWHMPQVQAEEAWDVTDGAGAVVAILDTGVRTGGPDGLCRPLLAEYNAMTNSTAPGAARDGYAHGTHVAGTIAGCTGNGIGVTGLAYGADVMAVKVLSDMGNGTFSDIAEGIVWAADHGAGVINKSLGSPCTTDWPACSTGPVNDAIAYAVAADVLVVVSAGNSNRGVVGMPANHPDVMAVSAMGPNRTRAPYSNWGTAVDLAAPGGDKSNGNEAGGVWQETFVRSTGVWGTYSYQGTSMAAPHVTGAAALLRSCAPEATAAEVRAALEDSAEDLGTPGFDTTYGHGFLQIYDALTLLAGRFARDVNQHCQFTGEPPCLTVTTDVLGEGQIDIAPAPDCPGGFSFETALTLTATPASGYWFAGWSGDATGTANPLQKTLYRNLALTAEFRPCLTVAATADGPGAVGVSPAPNCGGTGYRGGTQVTLTPTPDAGYTFNQWSGDATGTANPLSVTLNDDLSVSASFVACLSVTTHSDGPGTVGVSPAPNCAGGGGYNLRTPLTLTATPDPGYVFAGWSGGAGGTTNPLNLTLTADLDVTASFDDAPSVAVSLLANGAVGALAYGDEDVLAYDGGWTLLFDGSAHRLPGDVDALAILADNTLLLSPDAPVKNLPGIGSAAVDDSDVVRYSPTTGQYSWYFDGSDVGLSTNAEDIDALAVLPDGDLLISTLGAAAVPGVSAADEDVLRFHGTAGSKNTSGAWSLYIDGSDLSGALGDIDAVAVQGGAVYLSAEAAVMPAGQSMAPGDVFVCTGLTPGSATSCASISRVWQGTAAGLAAAANVDALEMIAP